ncbi:MAG: acetyltransferase [Nitrospirae bacterium]|nr:acetyltransferase [Nitrospirota bacterium]
MVDECNLTNDFEKEEFHLEKVIIFGNKSTAREVFFFLKYFSQYEVAGFTVDKDYIKSDTLFQLPVLPFCRNLTTVFPPDKFKMLIAVGYLQRNKLREERYFQSKEYGYELINFISPNAVIYSDIEIGDNCIVGHSTVISPNVKIGNNVIILSGCLICHDVIIENNCFFSPGVSVAGGVHIGSNSFLATNSIIRKNVSIGEESVIGAGAIILFDAKDQGVYVSEPATLIPISSNELNSK